MKNNWSSEGIIFLEMHRHIIELHDLHVILLIVQSATLHKEIIILNYNLALRIIF